MAVQTRIDARSSVNSSIQIQDADGKILATVEVVRSNEESNIGKLRNEANLRITTANDVRIVKQNGAILRRR